MNFFDKRLVSAKRQIKKIWIYNFRTNIHFTLKKSLMLDKDLDDGVAYYNQDNCHARKQTWLEGNPNGCWCEFTTDEIFKRDKTSMDIFWINDRVLADLDNLLDSDELTEDIIENLYSALESFQKLQE